MDHTPIKQRVDALRKLMRQHELQAFIIPSTDPHMSEYVAEHWESRKWISGFTGSAGTVVVTHDEAGLWTDSRYFIQASEQLQGSDIDLYKEMLPETPSIPSFLNSKLGTGAQVGIDGSVFSLNAKEQLEEALAIKGIKVVSITDPMDIIWTDRVALPQAVAQVYPITYAGKAPVEKLDIIRKEYQKCGANALLVSALDEIAWALNLRGSDVHCNPVVISYLFITDNDAHLFMPSSKVTPEVKLHLADASVQLHDYEEIGSFLNALQRCKILLNPAQTNYSVYASIPPTCEIMRSATPIAMLKAVRNEIEIEGIHQAMVRDGVALVQFLTWLSKAVPKGGQTEISVSNKLHKLRAAQPLYVGDSFDTIAGYGAHAAIVHYEATPETDIPLKPKGFLLLDSGAQYLDGTTDITRTIALGPLTHEEKEDYTLILKGHIDLAMAVFPEGTRGAQLDVLARMPIWQHHMNYLHGTGHGVGHYLNVHEGPQSIRMQENPLPLKAGMVTSNEPGVYKANSHGIRTENLVLTIPSGEGMFGNYLKFETLTLCPIDKAGIIKEMLSRDEIKWLNDYHQRVYDILAPHLEFEERYWLAQATSEL